jgi:hypothetical protein
VNKKKFFRLIANLGLLAKFIVKFEEKSFVRIVWGLKVE